MAIIKGWHFAKGGQVNLTVKHKNPEGGLNQAGRDAYNNATGMKSKLTSAKTARDPDSRINKSLRKWDC